MTLTADIEKSLWDAADQLWTNSGLRPDEYSTPVLALIFLKYADHRFAQVEAKLSEGSGRRRKALIEDYNAGSHNVQESFEQIRDFIRSLSEEEKRHAKEDLSQEELTIFDLLTKPNVELKKKDRQLVKDLARQLLQKLKEKELVLDWRKKRQARVRRCIEDVLDTLPEDAYSDKLYEEKCGLIYEHVYESYWGDGFGKFGVAG